MRRVSSSRVGLDMCSSPIWEQHILNACARRHSPIATGLSHICPSYTWWNHHSEWIIVREACVDQSHSLFLRRPVSTDTEAETCRLEGEGAAGWPIMNPSSIILSLGDLQQPAWAALSDIFKVASPMWRPVWVLPAASHVRAHALTAVNQGGPWGGIRLVFCVRGYTSK